MSHVDANVSRIVRDFKWYVGKLFPKCCVDGKSQSPSVERAATRRTAQSVALIPRQLTAQAHESTSRGYATVRPRVVDCESGRTDISAPAHVSRRRRAGLTSIAATGAFRWDMEKMDGGRREAGRERRPSRVDSVWKTSLKDRGCEPRAVPRSRWNRGGAVACRVCGAADSAAIREDFRPRTRSIRGRGVMSSVYGGPLQQELVERDEGECRQCRSLGLAVRTTEPVESD